MARARFRLAWLVLLATCTAPAAAQDPPPAPPQDPLVTMRTKETLADEDRAAHKTWIDERVAAIGGEDALAAGQAASQVRAAYDGTPAFKEAFAAVCVAAIGPALNGAEVVPATRLLAVLTALNEAAAQPIFLNALKDERPPMRLVAAAGLRNLRVKLSRAGGPFVTGTLSALKDAGTNETSTVVLETIYQALDFAEVVPSPPEPQANIAAVLDLLAARAAQHEQGSVKAEAAEIVGLRVAGALRGSMTDADKKRFTEAAGALLKYAVTQYIAGDAPLINLDDKAGKDALARRARIELLIEAAEKELAALLSPTSPPGITQRMRKEPKPGLIRIEMNKWADLLEKAVGKRYHLDEGNE
jgi:hypothetical protein